MAKTLAIRWHSRAGQGAITASSVLAEILGEQGQFVQSFPDFGAEKRGAAVVVFNRISREKIFDASQPEKIDMVVLLDTTLVESCEVPLSKLLEGLDREGYFLINTSKTSFTAPGSFKNIFALDASDIATTEIGKDIPNVPILGALVCLLNLAKVNDFILPLEKHLRRSLPPELVEGNLRAFERGYQEVKNIRSDRNPQKGSSKCDVLGGWKTGPLGAVISEPGSSKNYNTGNWVQQSCQWNKQTCINCLQCWPACPHGAIRVEKGNMLGVDISKCTACGLCVYACPTKPKSLGIISKQKRSN